MKVLLVEDEERIASFVRKGLQAQGMVVDHFDNGDDGYAAALNAPFDIVLLDIMLPGRDGLSILKNLRLKGITTPVIVLTARSELNERLEGLNLGADDYLVKPFYVDELIARIHAVSRRSSGSASNSLTVGSLVLDLHNREVHLGGERIELANREFNLLELLMRSPGRIYSRVQILERVWNYDFDPNTNVVDVYIRRLRAKIDSDPGNSAIETVRGVGYRLRKPA
jgi:two-component system OmpR family response regulator